MKRARAAAAVDEEPEALVQAELAEDGAALLERANAVDALAAENAEVPAKPAGGKGRGKKAPAEPVARLVPPALHATNDLAFSCTFPYGHRLAFTMVRAASVGKTAEVDFMPNGLKMQQMSSFGSCFVELNVPAASFLAWKVPDQGCTRVFFYEELEFLAANSKPEHSLTLYATHNDPDYVWARLFSADSDRRIRLSLNGAANMQDILQLPHETWPYPCRIRMNSLALRDEIALCERAKSVAVELTLNAGNKLVITTFCDDARREQNTTYQSLVDTEGILPGHELNATGIEADELFVVKFFSLLLKMREMSSRVDLSFGLAKKPLRLVFAMETPGNVDGPVLGTVTALLMDKEK